MTSNRSGGIVKTILVGIACLWVFAIVFRVGTAYRSNTLNTSAAPAPAQKPAPTDRPPIKVTAATLYAQYHRNEVAGDSDYKGRRLEVTGRVASIEKDIFDKPFVTLITTRAGVRGVVCRFEKGATGPIVDLLPGQSATFTGTCSGMILGDVQIHCD